ncbi:GNAT family N-acetyltransferase [Lichenicoccus sp.]|uniref:GNAT family N-acetyltransferase n=1 Tax=Lichenicoccus sp. TaxID=2781899 RepID=UPI003D13229C
MCPKLETPRLTLQGHTPSDFDDLAAMWADPLVVRHITGKASTPQESWSRLLRNRGLWSVLGYGYWCVRETRSGRYVGDVGFADFRRDSGPSVRGVPEAGWVLARWAHGRGFAHEAVSAILSWLDGSTEHERVVCFIVAGNAPSIRIAEKSGFVASGIVRLNDEAVSLWERKRAPPGSGRRG